MRKLAIIGSLARSSETIKLLEMLGGKNTRELEGDSQIYYYIKSGEILCSSYLGDDYNVYTLEEYFKKFPFIVGDKVNMPDCEFDVEIIGMEYSCDDSVEHVSYKVYCDKFSDWYNEVELLSFGNDIENYQSRYTKSINTEDININNLGIKGHSSRSEDVKSLLVMLGGRIDVEDLPFNDDNFVLYIGNNKCVYPATVNSFEGISYSLEEFEKEFPYKTGDLVNCYVNFEYGTFKIEKMYWFNLLGKSTVRYVINNLHFYTSDLKPCESNSKISDCQDGASLGSKVNNDMDKCKTYGSDSDIFNLDIRKENTDIEYPLPDGFQFIDDRGQVIDTTKVILKRIKIEYPKDYKECCDVLCIPPYYNLRYHTYANGYNKYTTSDYLLSLQDKLTALGKLLICRNAYWKVAGEQMGLGRPWNPDFANFNGEQCYYTIISRYGVIHRTTEYTNDVILVFPTKEIQEEFYNNFKSLIEDCKGLIQNSTMITEEFDEES